MTALSPFPLPREIPSPLRPGELLFIGYPDGTTEDANWSLTVRMMARDGDPMPEWIGALDPHRAGGWRPLMDELRAALADAGWNDPDDAPDVSLWEHERTEAALAQVL